MKRWISITIIVILEAVAIIGAIPLMARTRWFQPYTGFLPKGEGHTITYHVAVWDNNGALIGFLIIAVILMVFLSRRESRQIRVLMSLGVPALLFGTIRLIQWF